MNVAKRILDAFFFIKQMKKIESMQEYQKQKLNVQKCFD